MLGIEDERHYQQMAISLMLQLNLEMIPNIKLVLYTATNCWEYYMMKAEAYLVSLFPWLTLFFQ